MKKCFKQIIVLCLTTIFLHLLSPSFAVMALGAETTGSYRMREFSVTIAFGDDTKRVGRTHRNSGYLDAFRYTVDDIVGTEQALAWQIGWTAFGAFILGGLGALAAFGFGKSILNNSQKVIDLTAKAQGFYWNV